MFTDASFWITYHPRVPSLGWIETGVIREARFESARERDAFARLSTVSTIDKGIELLP